MGSYITLYQLPSSRNIDSMVIMNDNGRARGILKVRNFIVEMKKSKKMFSYNLRPPARIPNVTPLITVMEPSD
jgi:hypothetical protein